MVIKTAVCSLALLLSSFVYSQDSQQSYEDIQDTNSLHILTPSLKNISTAKIRLENGLEAFLISDPGAEESAAALAVNVGSWSDPKEYPGMAHFLEHMLFMGTKAYPDTNGYSQYITDHGGSSNAYTALDRTVYLFSVNNSAFEEALDRFSHFFIDPLFKTAEVGKELHAVDQEHAKNIQSDGRREWMIFKETGNQAHPNRSFATGNAETLGHIPQQALISWYQKNYKASKMHLAIYSNLPLSTLKELTVKDFAQVPNHTPIQPIAYAPISSQEQLGHMIYIKPIKNLKLLSLQWELPQYSKEDESTHAAELIAYVLSYGSKNSLIEILKQEHLIEGLQANVSDISHDNRLIGIDIALTEKGIQQINTVIERCFQALNFLKKQGIPSYLFQEMQTMTTLNYEYQSRQNPSNLVTDIADDLIDEPLASYPQKTLLASEYNPKAIQSILNLMTPQKCIFIVMAPPELTGVAPNKKEQWNGGEYAIRAVNPSLLNQWTRQAPPAIIALPAPNPYLPSSLHLVHTSSDSKAPPIPVLINDTDLGKNYFWGDVRYGTPSIDYHLGIRSPWIDGTPRSCAALDLFIKTFYQKNSPLLVSAAIGNLQADLEIKNFQLMLSICGYSEKAPRFCKEILSALKNLSCTKDEFQLYKDSLLDSYSNETKNAPYVQAGAVISNILYNDAPLPLQKKEALAQLSYDDFLGFIKQLFSRCYIEGLYAGNLLQSDAENLSMQVANILGYSSYPTDMRYQQQVLVLPNDGPYVVTKKMDVLGNAALLAVEEGPFSFSKKAGQLILDNILSEAFFDTLRSKQQTGYIAASWSKEVNQELLQYFLVQSSSHQPEDLLWRFEAFLEDYIKDFAQKIPVERFNEVKKNCIETLQQEPKNLQEMASYLYTLAFIRHGDFSYTQEVIDAAETLNYETLQELAYTFLSRHNARRLAVLMEGQMPQAPFSYHQTSPECLKEKGYFNTPPTPINLTK